MTITIFTLVIAFFMTVHISTGAYVLIKCRSRKKNTFLGLMLPGFLLLLSSMLEINSVGVDTAFISTKLMHMSFSFSASVILIFVADFCDYKLHRALIAVLLFFSGFISVMVWTNESHNMIYTYFGLETDAFLPFPIREIGAIGLLSRIHTTGMLISAFSLLIYKYIKSDKEIRSRIFLLIFGVFVAALGIVAYTFTPFGLPINYWIFTTSVFVVLSALSILKDDILEAAQTKRDFFAFDIEGKQAADNSVKLMFDVAPMIIQHWDAGYNCIDCNQRALDFYSCGTKEEYFILSKDFKPKHQPDGRLSWDVWTDFLKKVLDVGQEVTTFQEANPDGQDKFFEVTGVRVNDSKEAVITYSMDITNELDRKKEQHRARVAEEANLAKSRFLARMSHEIRTPISAVIGISEIQLKNPALPPAIEESFFHIFKSAQMLHWLINDILDLSKIESGKMDLTSEKYETASLIRDAVNMSHAQIKNKDIKFKISVDEKLPMFLMGDFVRISQVINNLLSNAFKYTPSGEVGLTLGCEPGYLNEADENYVTFVVSIRDTGLGMTKEQVQSIFDEYSRFHEKKGHIQGVGLGMAIVSNLLNLMDARIEVQSEENEGTTVTAYIPQEISGSEVMGKENALRLQQFEKSSYIASKRFHSVPESMPYGKVLVVDDVDANLYVSRGLMEFYELAIETAGSGFDALEKIKQGNTYDIIFIDHMMPYMDGTETMRELRKCGYLAPIVVLTANAIKGQAEMFMSDGFDGYLSKPIQTNELDFYLNKFIKNKQTPETLEAAARNQKTSPVSVQGIEHFQTNPELIKRLRADFAAEQKNAVAKMQKALNAGDIKNAHLIIHTLKGCAALILEKSLSENAETVEQLLKTGEIPAPAAVSALENELARVVNEIKVSRQSAKILSSAEKPDAPNYDELMDLLDNLQEMLEQRKSGSRNALGRLRDIPEAAIMVKQVDKFDFAVALKSLAALRLVLEERDF
ncbi:MAG: ATP-binding protein [Defluviitaleaceae bacterium]|nr:ATP-binding protein [Defluviitaleaceae bacterium]